MKRLLSVLLAMLVLLSFAACGEEEEMTDMDLDLSGIASEEETFVDATAAPTKEIVEEVTEEVTEAATEETIAPTEEATEEITEPATQEATLSLAGQYIAYCGKWNSTTQYHFMELFLEGEVLYLDYSCCSANANRIAMVLASVELKDIQDGKATFTYSDDGWGNQGTLVMEFVSDEQIVCTATTTYQNPGANWSIVEGTVTFERAK